MPPSSLHPWESAVSSRFLQVATWWHMAGHARCGLHDPRSFLGCTLCISKEVSDSWGHHSHLGGKGKSAAALPRKRYLENIYIYISAISLKEGDSLQKKKEWNSTLTCFVLLYVFIQRIGGYCYWQRMKSFSDNSSQPVTTEPIWAALYHVIAMLGHRRDQSHRYQMYTDLTLYLRVLPLHLNRNI